MREGNTNYNLVSSLTTNKYGLFRMDAVYTEYLVPKTLYEVCVFTSDNHFYDTLFF